jgi:His-Xaa-Ser system radical SAM maturase HxsB
MPLDVAVKVVDTIFQTPSPSVKIEFQGGEPLLNWKAVKEIVGHAEKLNRQKRKNLEFVICTNLTLMDQDKLAFIKDHGILISTSLDGPRDLHDANRVLRNGHSSHDLFMEKLALTRSALGKGSVSALMTTSIESLGRMRDIVDEYVHQGFNGIFVRALNPFGYAKTDIKSLGYSTEEFIEAYKDVLGYIIELNREGTYFEEYYTSLLLTRILTPFCTGFVDLQSPAGAGICGAIYDRNGDVYPCDEGRMLAKTGDRRFRLGNVMRDGYFSMFGGSAMRELTSNSCVETLPGCASCVYQIYCGADPIRNYAEQGEIIGHRPTSSFCRKNRAIFDHLFQLFRENDEGVMDVFWSWITRRPLQDIQHVELPRKTA